VNQGSPNSLGQYNKGTSGIQSNMKKAAIKNVGATHRFVRQYMAAASIEDLNVLKYEGRCNTRPVINLLGDKPSQPTSDRLTFQPFATL
jgi:hypothetical protein